jgi:ribonuclease BN (tRNA processing enzyme)
VKLVFLGTRGEIEARRPRHRRHSAMLVVHQRRRVLVDCGADWLGKLRTISPHAIVLTHAHPDHAFGLARGAACPVLATEATWRVIDRFPIARRIIVPARRGFVLEGVRFEAWQVEHSLNAPAVGYRIGTGSTRLFYVPDVVSIPHRAAALRDVRLYIGDGATLTRPLLRRRGANRIGHSPVATQMQWCRAAGIRRALITHCGSEIVKAPHARMVDRVRELGRKFGVQAELAVDGMTRVLRRAACPPSAQ